MKNLFKLKNLLLIVTVAFLGSCNDDDIVDPGDNSAGGVSISDPTSIAASTKINTITTEGQEYSFNYRNDGKIGTVNSSISFSDEWGQIEGQSIYTFNYTDDRLSSIVHQDNITYKPIGGENQTSSSTRTQNFIYNNKNLVSMVKWTVSYEDSDGREDSYTTDIIREYDAQNRLVKESEDEEGIIEEYTSFIWEGTNVTKESHFDISQDDNSGGRLKGLKKERQKPNFFHRNARKKAADLEGETVLSDFDNAPNSLMILTLLDDNTSGVTISKSNARKIMYYWENDGAMELEEKITISHTYDQKNRPTLYKVTTIEIDEDGKEEPGEIFELKITYLD